MGTGTGRNLIRLARRSTGVRLYGIDVSRVMLATASAAIERAGIAERVSLAEANIEAFDPVRSFRIDKFDVVYFSYVLSMVPDWRRAVTRAIELLRPGGTLAVVAFAHQAQASPLRPRILLACVALVGIHPRPVIQRVLRALPRPFYQGAHQPPPRPR